MNKNDETNFDSGVIKIDRLTRMMSIFMPRYEMNRVRKRGEGGSFNGGELEVGD